MVYARKYQDREFTFDFGEGLIQHNLLMVDRETSSVWSQLDGAAVSGPQTGQPLKMIGAFQTTWGFWRKQHPSTVAMIVRDEEGKPYFYRDWDPGAPRPENLPQRHDISQLGLGLVVGGHALFFPLRELQLTSSPVIWSVDGKPLTIHYSAQGLTAWAQDAEGKLLPSVLAYRRGWLDFYPESQVFSISESGG